MNNKTDTHQSYLIAFLESVSLADLLWDYLKLFLKVDVNVCFSSSSVIASSFMWNLLNQVAGKKALTNTP